MKTIAAAGLATLLLTGSVQAKNLLDDYTAGVRDAAVAEESERADDLVPITADNNSLAWNEGRTKIRVATWKAQGAFDQFLKPYSATSDNEAYPVWVTAAPRMQERCRQFRQENPDAGKEQVDLFLKQFLGLHPDWNYDVFVELWVEPSALFRPCVDPIPDDRTCDVHFADTVAKVPGIANYRNFYENLYFGSSRFPPGVPWTGLGYTYNWGNPENEQGASEFILSPGSPYEIAATVPTMDYCRPE